MDIDARTVGLIMPLLLAGDLFYATQLGFLFVWLILLYVRRIIDLNQPRHYTLRKKANVALS